MLVQEPSAGILLPCVRLGKLRHPASGGHGPAGGTVGLQGRERLQTSCSLPQLRTPSAARLAPVLCLLPALFLQVLKDSVRYKNELSDMSRMWVSRQPPSHRSRDTSGSLSSTRRLGWAGSAGGLDGGLAQEEPGSEQMLRRG